MDQKFKVIEEMGFTPAEAQEALTIARGDLSQALDWLLTHCPQGRVGVSAVAPSSAAPQGSGGAQSGSNTNFVPPPPLDSSDHENPQHLEALKRDTSNPQLPVASRPPVQQESSSSSDQPKATSDGPSAASPSASPLVSPPSPTPIPISAGAMQPSPIMANAPMIQVCYRGDSDGPTLAEKEKLLELLRREHMPCIGLDISNDREMEDLLASAQLQLPQAVLSYQPLGDLRDFSSNMTGLRRLVARKIAAGLQSEHSSTIDEYSKQPVSTGAVDGVMNLLASAASKFWTPSSATSSNRPTNSFIEFTVIKTNWFYRDQRRIIRFGTNGDFYRIDPSTNALREAVHYADITSLTVGPSKLELTLKDNAKHCYNAPSRVIDYMFQLFLSNAPEDLSLKFEP